MPMVQKLVRVKKLSSYRASRFAVVLYKEKCKFIAFTFGSFSFGC